MFSREMCLEMVKSSFPFFVFERCFEKIRPSIENGIEPCNAVWEYITILEYRENIEIHLQFLGGYWKTYSLSTLLQVGYDIILHVYI